MILHYDLDDFFFVGTHQFLSKHASLMAPLETRGVMREALEFLFSRMFVLSNCVGETRHCVRGPGIGSKHSGTVASAAFLHSQELMGCKLARPQFLDRFRIVQYTRYIDNLFFVLESGDTLDPLVQFLDVSLRPYKGKIEEVGNDNISFLDTTTFRGRSFYVLGCFSVKPRLKENGRYLNQESPHPTSVHTSWPLAIVKQLWSRSGDMSVFQSAKQEFIRRLRESQYDCDFVHWLDQQTQFFRPNHHFHVPRDIKPPAVWQPLPYHPALWRENTSRLASFMSRRENQELLQEALKHDNFEIRFAWRKCGPAFG